MCTVSIIALEGGGYRLVHNRDELRTRAIAEAPAVRTFGETEAIAPLDPDAGGSWIAVDARGRCVAVLNVNPPSDDPDANYRRDNASVSRGRLVPLLLGAEGWPPTSGAFEAETVKMRAHRALVIEPGPDGPDGPGGPRVAQWTSGAAESGGPNGWVERSTPEVWVSSGLGDALVLPRKRTFEELVLADPTPASQDRFQRHRWADRSHLSVLMARPDARTVSITTGEVTPEGVSMAYQPVIPEIDPDGEVRRDVPGELAEPQTVTLARAHSPDP
ncbi:MAG: NRDE family protein [Planctomycetota bacterium]